MNRLHYWRRHMTVIANLLLRDARPDDRALAALGHAQRTGTPTHCLLQQCPSSLSGLCLGASIQRSVPVSITTWIENSEAVKSMCSGVSKQVVLLEGLDCLITYLYIQSCSHITLFWNNLEKTRKLEKILWMASPQTGI